MKKKRTLKKRILLAFFSVLAVMLLSFFGWNYAFGTDAVLSYIEETVSSVESTHGVKVSLDEDGFYSISPEGDGELKILQLTDLHFSCGYITYALDCAAVDAIYAIVKETRPDLIVLTGDIISPIVFTGATGNSELMARAIGALFEKIEIPWTLVYGNHDDEGFMSKSELSEYFSAQPFSLFLKGPDTIDGEGNSVIKVKNEDGTLRHALFFLDSNGGSVTGYDNPHKNQIEWYKETVDRLRAEYGEFESVLYQHIPPKEMQTLADAYEKGDTNVEKLYGELVELNKRVAYGEDHGLYDALVLKGTTKYVFFGHDHTNLAAFRDKNDGIVLSYSPSIDFSAYPSTRFTSFQRGGTLVFLSKDGKARAEQIYSDAIE